MSITLKEVLRAVLVMTSAVLTAGALVYWFLPWGIAYLKAMEK